MKKIFPALLITGCGLIALMSSSCRKYENEPKDWFTSALTFDSLDQNGTVALYDLNNIYTYIPAGFDRIDNDYLDDGAGEAIPTRLNSTVANYYQGTISVTNNPDPYWGNSYYGIRRATIFLRNIDRVPVAALTKRYWKAEARWLRAYFYWELLKRYGGVPLLGDTLLTMNDDIQLPRNTFAQTVDYIVSECNAVKDSLRPEPIAEYGRVPRGAAVALKAKVLLYAASPLYNDPTKPVNPLVGYPTYDASRWQLVANACAELNALNFYNLIAGGNAAAFNNIFLTKTTSATEVIFAKNIPNNNTIEYLHAPVGYIISNARNYGFTSPTQNFVEAFTDTNGVAINATGTVYNAATPYAKRDPRLSGTIFYNGLPWLGRPVQTFEGGLDKPNNPSAAPLQTRTGYYLRKFMGNFATSTSYSAQNRVFPIFRYGEVVLNYAEALNELGKPDSAALQIIRLRQRAGIVAGTPARYGVKVGITQTEMRMLIQNERRIELAFEEQRFWDIRRWKTAPDVLGNVSLNGVKITNSAGVLTYQTVPVTTAYWYDRMYRMPIPYDEIIKNPKLVQNEGW